MAPRKPKAAVVQAPLLKRLPLWQQWAPADPPSTGAIIGCTLCTRSDSSAPLVGNTSGTKADIVVIVSQPTMEEDTKQRAYISALHNQLARGVLNNAAKETYRFVYATHCRGNKDDEQMAVAACRPHVRWEITQAQPRVVIATGREAVSSMVGVWVDTQRTRKCWTYVDGVYTVLLPALGDVVSNTFAKAAFAEDLRWALKETRPMPKGSTQVLANGAELKAYIKTLNRKDPIIFDVENNGSLWGADFELLCCGICQDPERPVVATPDAMREARAEFAALLSDRSYPKANQAIKYDRHALFRFTGVDMAGIMADTFLWSRLREPEAMAGLGPQSWTVGFGGYKEAAKQLGDEDGEDAGQNRFASMQRNDLHAYNGRDVAATALLVKTVRPEIEEVFSTWRNLIGPAFDALTHIERTGMLVNPMNVRAYDSLLTIRRDAAMAKLKGFNGVSDNFNPGSPVQLANLLFKEFKLPVLSRTKTGNPSTDKETLKELYEKTQHPILPALAELGIVRKQLSTYGLPMLDHISPIDGRIHTTFNLVRTGRLSSSRPNLQNIGSPQEPGDDGSWARGIFVAPEGHKLINLDYGQAELRVVCMLSGDVQMAKDFHAGHDYHTVTAAGIFGVDRDKVTKMQRKTAKSINFGLVYGQTDYGLSKALKIPLEDAQKYIAKLFKRLPGLKRWRDTALAKARSRGSLLSVWDPPGGRLGWKLRRQVWPIATEGTGQAAEKLRKHWENVALNTPVQGLANCFTLASLTELVRWTMDEAPRAKVVMTVHDSIVLEVPDDMVDEAITTGKAIMSQWPAGIVGMTVDAEVGSDWGHMEKV